MSDLKKKKYITGILIVVLLVGIIGLFLNGRVDKYKGLVKVNNASSKLLSSVGNTNFTTSNGTEEIEYKLTYTLDEVEGLTKRNVIIKGRLNSEYAVFKEINRSNVTSTLTNDGKEIEIEVRDVTLGEEQNIVIPVQITNAPNNENIVPEITIKEKTGEETRVNTESIKVETNSVEGIVYDENKIPVSNIELSINKNGREVKRTYTKENGTFIFSDLEEGNYEVKVEEEIYEIEGTSETSESNTKLEIRVKEVDKFNIETHKYIEKLDLVINGRKESYTYKEAEKVVQAVKNAKNISGEIEYKIVVRNNGEKETEVERVIDTPGEGLEFKESNNTGWKKTDGIIRYTPIEGSVLRSKEKREIKLVLSITNTNEIKTYINKLTTKGKIEEKVVYVINGKVKKEERVIEGDKIEKPNFEIEGLDGWYTDTNYTNKYKFSNPVNKDIILYAKTEEDKKEYTVRYIDKGEVVTSEVVEEGNKTTRPEDPSKRGYTFKCWTLGNNCYDFETPVTKDIDLESSYEIIEYTITYNLQQGIVTGNPSKYTVETDTFTLNSPSKTGYTFIGWTGSNGNSPSNVTIEKGSIGNKEYTANYDINNYQLEIDPKGGEYSGDLLINGDYGNIITIPEPNKTGYTFTGWTLTGSGTFSNGIYTFGEGNGKLEANYTLNTYDISYDYTSCNLSEDEVTSLNNKTSYTVEDNNFVLNNPNKYGYDFEGWTGTDLEEKQINVEVQTNKAKNLNFIANCKLHKYTVTFVDEGSVIETKEVEYNKKVTTIDNPTKNGYTFKYWLLDDNEYDFDSKITKDITLISSYEINNYTITYKGLTEEELSSLNNPTSYNIETANFTLNNPNNRLDEDEGGEVFVGWKEKNDNTPSMSISLPDTNNLGNKEYTAVWNERQPNVYNITYNLNGGSLEEENPSTYKKSELPITLNNPKKTGYTFTGWTGSNGSSPSNVTIPKNTTGDLSYEANYEINKYKIEFYNLKADGDYEKVNEVEKEYNTTLETAELPTVSLSGYTFKYFSLDKESGYIINTPITKNIKLYAVYDKDSYNITYNLNGGSLEEENPNTYSVDTNTFTLNNPKKTGYRFVGWTGSNGSSPQIEVKITKGSTGNKEYTANYEPIEYTITYNLDGGSLETGVTNPSNYTIETEDFTINNPKKTGYTFTGWTGTDLSSKTENVSITKGSTGNREYTANYNINKFNVEFYDMNTTGDYTLNKTIEDINYNTTIPTDKIPEVSLRGYTFKFWSLDKINEYSFETLITSDVKLYAVYEKNTYTITYDLDEGSLETGVTNPSTYQVDTESFTLNNPSKIGYEFIGWTGSNGEEPLKTISLPDDKLENKSYKANYSINKYKVTYMNGDDKFYEEEVEYNKKALGTEDKPEKAHNIFLKWLKEDNTEYDFDSLVTEDIILYASWEEVEAPVISHTPTEWTRNNVLVTITSDHTDYEYMYKVGSGNYQSYSEPFEVDENTSVYAYSVKSGIISVEGAHEITNIDRINPNINLFQNTAVSPTSATVNVKAQDNESGMDIIKIYLGNELIFESDSYTTDLNEEKELEYVIENLEQLSDYVVKLEVIDKVGNTSNEEINISTPEKHYVARTLNDDGTEIEKYETLKAAIESTECVSICNIQMLDNVTETNSVLNGQDIKLDLNGLTISGLTDKTFENNGTLQILDTNEEEIGKIYSEGTTIINTGKLIIGEDESLKEEELVVDANEPIIEGEITGINSPGELHFYDGKIIGGSTTGALKGTAPKTPFPYNASVETTGGKEIATLEVIADAEARINSVYYTKVQEAVDSSKIGSYNTPEGLAEIMSQLETKSDYGFVYDEETGTLKTNNQGINNSTANSNIEFDLTNETNDKVLSIDASISSQGGADIGYVTIKDSKNIPLYSDSDGRLIYISGTNNDNINYLLEKGKKYYLHLGYRKDGGTNSGDDTFTINSIKLSDYTKEDVTGELLDQIISTDIYHFKKNSEGGYVNTNIGSNYTTAHSYIKVDLTDETDNKMVYIDASVSSPEWYSNIDYGYITITNSEEMPPYDQEEGRVLFKNGNNGRQLYEINLIPGQVNYIHFGYSKFNTYNNGRYSDTFNIYSVKLQSTSIKEHINSDITQNGTYYMYETNEQSWLWKDLSGNNNNANIYNGTWNEENGLYLPTPYNSYVDIYDPTFEIEDEETVEIEFSTSSYGNEVLYQGYTNEKIGIFMINSNLCISNESSICYNVPSDLHDGTKKKLTVVYNEGNYKLYYNGVELNGSYTSTYIAPKWSHIRIGGEREGISVARPARTIYSVKTYTRALTEEEIANGSSLNDNLVLYLDGSNHKVTTENSVFINNNQYKHNTTASSYMTFDLTNYPANKTIYVNAEISSYAYSSYYGDFGYVTVTGSTDVPAYNNTSGRYIYLYGDAEAKEYPVVLTGGRVNYVHFCYYKDGNDNGGTDTFKINYIKYYEDSSETIPEYIFSNSTTKKSYTPQPVLNEEPDVIQLIRNVTVTKPVEITETRNAILDLNGFTLTTSKDDYVVKNSGSLKIIDGKYNEQINTEKAKYDVLQEEFNTEYETKLAEQQEYLNTVQETFDSKYESDMQNAINNHTEPEYTYFIKDGYTNEDNKIAFDAWSSQTVRYDEGQGVYFNCNSGSNYTGFIFSNEKIDITDYDKMVVKYKFTKMNGRVDLFLSEGKSRGNLGQINNYVSTTPVLGNEETFEVDLSSATGEWYLAFDTPATQNQGYVTDFYLVKGDEGFTKMSSNNESLLYTSSVNASSVEKNHDAYKLFDKSINETDSFQTDLVEGDINNKSYSEVLLTGKTEYTMTDFDVYYGSNPQTYPSSIKLYGSNDNENYKLISDNNIDSSSIISETAYKYTIDSYDSYKYYKWVFESDNDSILIEEIIPTVYNVKRDKTTDTSKMISYDNNIYTIDDYVSDGLLLHYDSKSRGNEEGIWKDLSENNNDGTLVNATYDDSKKAFRFNGSNAYIYKSNENISIDENETVEVMFSTNTTGNQVFYNGSNTQKIGIGTWDGYIIVANKSANSYTYDIPSNLADGKIHTISVVYKDSEYKAYFDNKLMTRRTNTNNWGSNTNVYVGVRSNGNYFNGYIYNVKVYNKALTQDEIVKNYNVNATRYNLGEIKRREPTLETPTGTGNVVSTTYSTILNDYDAYLDVDSIINLNKSGNLDVITNRGKLTLSENAIVSGMQTSNRGINNTERGDILEGSGNINMTGSSNIGILNQSMIDENIKGYNVNVTSSNSYNMYNNSKIKNTFEKIKTSGSGIDIYQNVDNDLIVKDSILGSTSNESFYSNESSVESTITFNNCDIKNRIHNRQNSYRKIVISDSTMSGSRENIFNFHGKVEVNNSELDNSSYNIQQAYGLTTINNSTLKSNNRNIQGEYNWNSGGSIIIDNSTLTAGEYNIYSYRSNIEANNSTLNAYGTSIYNGYIGGNNVYRGSVSLLNTNINKTGPGNVNVVYNYAGDITINGGSIKNASNNSTAIYSERYGETSVVGNFRTSENFAKGIINYGKLTLGNNEDSVSKKYPLIRSTDSSIYTGENTEFKYYDGKLIGIKDNTIDGQINEIPNSYDINVTKGKDLDTIVLDTEEDRHEKNDYVAQIGSKKYVSIQEAVDSITSDDETEIVLLKNIETYLDVKIPQNKNVKLNYNKKGIKVYNLDNYFENNGTLTFVDDSNSNIVNNKFYTKKFIINNGTINYNNIRTEALRSDLAISNSATSVLNINDGEIYSYQSGVIENSGTMNMTGGKIYTSRTSATDAPSNNLITNELTGEITLNGGEIAFIGSGAAISNKNKVLVNDIKFNGYGYNAYRTAYHYTTFIDATEATSDTKIYGGTYGDTSGYGKLLKNAGEAEVKNVTSNLYGSVENSGNVLLENTFMNNLSSTETMGYCPTTIGYLYNSGDMKITGGSYKGTVCSEALLYNINKLEIYENTTFQISNSHPVLKLSSDSTATIDKAKFYQTSTSSYEGSVIIEGSASATISNSEITAQASRYNDNSSSSGIVHNSTDEVNLEKVTVTSNSDSIFMRNTGTLNIKSGSYTSSALRSIYNTNGGIINIGQKGGVPSKENPELTGNTYGIYNSNDSATINFYDGVITGETSIVGVINEIEPQYDIILEIKSGKEVKYLDKLPVYMNMNKTEDENNTYDSLQDAFDAASDGDTIKLLRELTTLNTLETASNDKELTLDLNGKKIIQNNPTFISNSGNLTIKDSTATLDENGIYQGTGTIESNGTSIINNTGSLTINSGNLYTKTTKVIDNTGTLNINNGNIYMTANTGGATSDLIINSATGIVNINGGYLKTTSQSSSKGSIVNNDGTVTINDGRFDIIGHSGGRTYIVYNATENSNANILGGTYISKDVGYDYNSIMYNNGTGLIKDISISYSYIVSNQSTGDLTLKNVTAEYSGNKNVLLEDCIYSTGTLEIDNLVLSDSRNNSYLINISGGTATINNSTINVGARVLYLGGSSTTTLKGCEITSQYDRALFMEGSSNLNIKESDISTTYSNSNIGGYNSLINNESSGLLNIESGNIKAENLACAIYSTGSGKSITVGKKGGTVDETPVIKGMLYPIYHSTEDPNILIDLKIYDGKLIAQNYLYGNIVETETNNYILKKEEGNLKVMSVGKEYAVKNLTKETNHYTIKEAIDNATSEDELLVLRNITLTSIDDSISVPTGMKLSLDLNNYSITFNEKECINNEGELEIKDSSANKKGIINDYNSKLLTNSGIFTLKDVTMRSYKIYTDVITNTGTINNDGSIIVNLSDNDMSGGKDTSIVNDGTFNSSGILKNTNGSCGYLEWYGKGPTYLIKNRVGGTVNITGGEVTYYAQGSPVYNLGTLNVTGGDFSNSSCNGGNSSIIRNGGTSIITGGTFGTSENKMKKTIFNNEGTQTVSNLTIYASVYSINNSGKLTLNDDTMYFEDIAINSSGSSLIVNNGTYTSSGARPIISSSSDTKIEGVTLKNEVSTGLLLELSNKTTVKNSILLAKGTVMSANGGSDVTLNNSSIESTESNGIYINGGTVNVKDLSPYMIKSDTANAIYIDAGELNIGESGGIPSLVEPTIYGKTYGLYNNSTSSTINFYDGLIKGETGSIYGTITDTAAGYKEKRDNVTNPDTGVTTVESTLTVVGTTERVAVVNNINFLSLQSAINYASNNNIENIQMYKSITLEDNLVKPEGGSNVKIYLGNYTITTGDYTLDDGIEIVNGTAPGASLSRFLANITGTEINPRNIVIFEMEDGSKLDPSVTYKLYKIIDGNNKIVRVKENSIGDYDLGLETEDLRTTRSRIYINDIGEGTYKLVGSDLKELTFTIDATTVSNNIRINNGSKTNRTVEAIATLILQLQTGVVRHPYILIIMILIVLILSAIAYKKYKKDYEI